MKGSYCLTNLISFYDQVIHLVDEGKATQISAKPLTWYSPGEAGSLWPGQVHSLLGKEVAGGLGTECW